MQAARGASLTSSDHDQTSRSALRLFAGVAGVAYALDLSTKVWAVEALSGRPPQPFLGDILVLDLVRNPGAAFSTGTSFTLALSLVSIAAALSVLWFARRLGSPLWAVGLGFLLGGVLGNLTDRVFRQPGFLEGHVVDFLRLPNWPVFNVADMCINAAAVVIVLQAFRGVSLSGGRAGPDDLPTRGPDGLSPVAPGER